MTGRGRMWARALAPLALSALVAGLLLSRPVHVQTSLYDLVGDMASTVPASVRNRSNDRASVVVSAKSENAALSAADAFVAALPADLGAAVRHKDDGAAFAEMRTFYASHGSGVVSSADAERLKTPEGRAKIARAAIRRHFSVPVTLFTPVQDPFGLLAGFAASLPTSVMGWSPRKDGVLVAERDGETHVLVSFTLPPSVSGDMDALERFASGLRAARNAAAREGVRFAASGVPLHAAETASRCRREIGWLGVFSMLFIACLGLWAFRTWKVVVWFALSLANAALAGFAALVLFAPSFHLIALVFGTTVLGLVIDYSFHWLLRSEADERATRRNLLVSCATTEVSLVPLACASLPALAQSAVFLGAGLVAALATVLWLYPRAWRGMWCEAGRRGRRPRPTCARGLAWGVFGIVCVALVAGLPHARFETPLAALYRPPAELAAAEAQFARLSGSDAGHGFLVTTCAAGVAETLDDMLAREARALKRRGRRFSGEASQSSQGVASLRRRHQVRQRTDAVASLVTPAERRDPLGDAALVTPAERRDPLGDVACLSRFLPPLAERTANWENVNLLYAEQGEKLRSALKLAALPAPEAPRAWDAKTLPRAIAENFLADGALVASNVPADAGADMDMSDGVVFWRPADLSCVLTAWGRQSVGLFLAAAAAMFALLLVFVRGRAVRVFAPAVVSFLVVVAALTVRGEPVNLFHMLAGFLLLGMGVDYAVFLHESRGRAVKSALCALLTSMVGFGALAFVSFPVVAAFGFALGVGLPVAFLLAWASAPRDADTAPATEHGASPLGLELAWLAYRVFGKRALNALAAAIGLCIWMFSAGARKASRGPGKAMRFARSLADKFVVMCEGPGQPCVETDGSDDAAAFVADVQAKKGVFVLSSHCGTVEVLAALGACDVTFHAWMAFAQTAVFNAFYARHAKRRRVRVHPIETFGMASAFEAGDWLDAGDCAVMAADFESATAADGSPRIAVSEGAVRFARALGHPVYFVACVRTRGSQYRAIVRKLPTETRAGLADAYRAALEAVVREHPEEWFRWMDRG